MMAKAIEAVSVLALETLPNGVKVAIVPCANYDVLSALPQAIELDGVRFGRTGWNSDACVAYFRTDAMFGTAC